MPEPKGKKLTTVRVPVPFEGPFLTAQDYVARYFADRVENPDNATIQIAGERYVLLRAASLSVEFMEMVTKLYQDQGEAEARSVANNLLFDLAQQIVHQQQRQRSRQQFPPLRFGCRLLSLELRQFRFEFLAAQIEFATLAAKLIFPGAQRLAQPPGLIHQCALLHRHLLLLPFNLLQFSPRLRQRLRRRCIQTLGLFAPFEHLQITFQSIYQIHPQQCMNRRAENVRRMTTLRQILDLLAVKEKQMGNAARQ